MGNPYSLIFTPVLKSTVPFMSANVLYPLSLEKISRLYRGAIDNGFASFSEA